MENSQIAPVLDASVHHSEARWLIVSNRLPFMRDSTTGLFRPSSGGLVTAIQGIKNDLKKMWIGIAPDCATPAEWNERVPQELREQFTPVFVQPDEYGRYYNGFSNGVLWPLLHYESDAMNFTPEGWRSYQTVNAQVAEVVAKTAKRGDLVWIHDFHLFLVPRLLRELRSDLAIGFFLHVPFPSEEVFRQLPMRREVLSGVIDADLIGFHDFSYLRHFCSALQRLLGLNPEAIRVEHEGRTTTLGVFPVSIDTEHFAESARETHVRNRARAIRRSANNRQIILGVDRLDYTKGIELKFRGFRHFLRTFPEWRDKVTLLQLAIPTRENVEFYRKLREEVEGLVGEINGEFGSAEHVPIRYLYTSVDFAELLALYRASDVLLVTSKRDGMNLVSQEFIAAQDSHAPGIVILSEFAGATSNLSHVIVVNPWNVEDIAHRLEEALRSPHKARKEAHQTMFQYLSTYTATRWAESFMQSLSDSSELPQRRTRNALNVERELAPEIVSYLERAATELVLFIDYDGTLVPIRPTPAEARISEKEREFLLWASALPGVRVVVVSGRPRNFLREQLRDIPVTLAPEHGAQVIDRVEGRVKNLVRTDFRSWFKSALAFMQQVTDRVPGSFIEQKTFSLAWHYRRAPKEYGDFQAQRMVAELRSILADLPATVLAGKKVIEVRATEADKGLFAKWFLQRKEQPKDRLAVGIGDDETDENLFRVVGAEGVTLKVGLGFTNASHRILDQQLVIPTVTKLLTHWVRIHSGSTSNKALLVQERPSAEG